MKPKNTIREVFNPLTAVGTLGTKFSKPHYYFGIGPFLNPINYFGYKKVKLVFSEEILIFLTTVNLIRLICLITN